MNRTSLTVLAVFSLAASARAQTLSNFSPGDTVTVSGAGTTGVYQGVSLSNDFVTTYTATATPGAAVAINQGAFTLASGGTLSGGNLALGDGLDAGLTPATALGTGNPNVAITGGTVSGYYAINVGAGIVTITGGHITGSLQGAGLLAQTAVLNTASYFGTINMYGAFTDHAPGSSVSGVGLGTVTGTLQDGTPIATTYQLAGGTINFLPAPEPSPAAVLGLGMLGVGALAIKAKKRTA